MNNAKIVQIMPAIGWYLRTDEPARQFIPLVGWALIVDDANITDVVGLIASSTTRSKVELVGKGEPTFSGYYTEAEMKAYLAKTRRHH